MEIWQSEKSTSRRELSSASQICTAGRFCRSARQTTSQICRAGHPRVEICLAEPPNKSILKNKLPSACQICTPGLLALHICKTNYFPELQSRTSKCAGLCSSVCDAFIFINTCSSAKGWYARHDLSLRMRIRTDTFLDNGPMHNRVPIE